MSYSQFNMEQTNYKVQHIDIQIDYPADAPANHPRIIDLNFPKDVLPEDLDARDVFVSIMFKWSPKALSKLQNKNFETDNCYFGFIKDQKVEYYIHRKDNVTVTAGKKKPGTDDVKFEVTYHIEDDGAWRMSHFIEAPNTSKIYFTRSPKRCVQKTQKFAMEIATGQIWKRTLGSKVCIINGKVLPENIDNSCNKTGGIRTWYSFRVSEIFLVLLLILVLYKQYQLEQKSADIPSIPKATSFYS